MSRVTTQRVAAWDGRTTRRGAGLQRFVAGWAAFGVTLSGATQLRMAGLPLGPSELILVAWILFVVFLLLRGVKFARSRVLLVLGAYWLGALILLGLGALIAVQTRRADLGVMVRDGIAFFYVAVLTCFLALRLLDENTYQYHWHFARLTFLFHALAAGLLLGLTIVPAQLGPISLWYGGIRFRGWSENPNQMALAMAAMPFLGWWLMRQTSGLFDKAVCALGIALCTAAGVATESDGLRVAWAASLGVIAALLFYRVTMRGRSRWLYISHIMVPALVVAIGVYLGDELVAYFSHVAEGIYAEGAQGEKRFTLWSHGIEAIRASPLFGFGPGPFSGSSGPFQGGEAHNSFIDWGMSTGFTGILLFVALLAWVVWRALWSREVTLVGMWMSVVVVSIFGFVLRQPDFWMVLVLVLILSEQAITSRHRPAGRLVLEPGAQMRRPISRSAPTLERIGAR
jgi:O-antigen ligase